MAAKRKQVVKARKPTQDRSRETVKAIVQAAEKVLAEAGQEGFTTTRIAEVAGVSKGTLYEYFRTTNDVLRAVEEYSWSQVIVQITHAMHGEPPATYEEGISRLVHACFNGIEHRATMHGFTLDAVGDENSRGEMLEIFARAGAARLESRVSRERLRPPDIQLAAEILTCVVPFLVWLGLREFPRRNDPTKFREAVILLVQSFLLRDDTASTLPSATLPSATLVER